MGNRVFLSLRYLFFVLFFIYQAAAVSQEYAWDSIGKNKKTNIPCTISFSELRFVGMKFEGDATCVKAESDGEARIQCGNGSFINPGNPQYSAKAVGEYDTNPYAKGGGYYYCLNDKSKRNQKFHMCTVLAYKMSEYRSGDEITDPEKKVRFEWYSYPNKKYDGLCYCGIGKNLRDGGMRDCAQAGPEALAETPKEDKAPETKASETKKPESSGPDSSLVSCVEDWKKAADQCKATAEDAKKTCDPKSEEAAKSKGVNDVISVVTEGYTNFKAGSGSQQECFKASLLGSSASGLLTLQSDSCESKVDLCTSSCDKEELNKKKKACEDILTKIVEKDADASADNSPTRVNSQFYGDGLNYVDEKTNEGEKICGTEAKKDQSVLSSMLDSVGKSMASSLKCMCQLSSSPSVKCNEIVTPQDCTQNPTGVGCSTYGSIAVCTVGAMGYDANLCNCQMNPKDAGCPGGALSGGLVGFAGAGIRSGGPSDTGIIASGIKPVSPSDIAIPIGDQSSTGTPLQLPSSSGPGSSPGAGGGPGGGGPGGGDSSAKNDAGAPPEEKGISGLFNQAKSFISSMLGKKSPSNSNLNSKNSKNENGFDPNKFKPRVPASKRGYGTKNQDIWKMSNSCMYAETCQSNMNNFMDNPLKQK